MYRLKYLTRSSLHRHSLPHSLFVRFYSDDSTRTVVPLHAKPHLIQPCIDMLKESWPGSIKAYRLEILEKFCIGLPCSLVLVQNLDQPGEKVLGHSRIVEVKNINNCIYMETGCIHTDYRKQKLGAEMLLKMEQYCKIQGFRWSILNTSLGLAKSMHIPMGYRYCDWRYETVGCGMLGCPVSARQFNLPCPGWERYYVKLDNFDANDQYLSSSLVCDRPSDSTNTHMFQSDGEYVEPPTWCFDYFNRDYYSPSCCNLKKAL